MDEHTDEYPALIGSAVATTTEPQPVVGTTTAPPPYTPSKGGGPRLAAVVVVVIGLITALALSQASVLAFTRATAYPHPAISVSVDGTGPYRVGTPIQFSVTASAGTQLAYAWDFGDSGTATGATVSHTYSDYGNNGTYTVGVTATDPIGQSGTATTQVSVLPLPPTACFIDSAGAQDPLTYTFNANCSTGTQLRYSWDYGDGTSDEGVQTTHLYAQGTYTVTLTVTDVANQSDTHANSVTVTIPPPHASFTSSVVTNFGTQTEYQFDASGSTGYQLTFAWTFSSSFGTYSSSSEVDTEFLQNGYTWTVQLTITDGLGHTDSSSTTVSPS